MKRLMVIGLVLLIIVSCEGEKDTINQGPVVLHQEYVEPGTDEPYNGERIIQNDSLNLRAKAIYVDGYPKTVTYYNSNEQKKTELIVADEGKGEVKSHTEWYKNGQKKFEHHDNFMKEWFENGELKAEVPYDDNGDLHGIAKSWDEEGNLTEENYEHGTLVDNADSMKN